MKNLILPALTLGIRPLATLTQLTKNSMLDALSQDYIRTARAKGMGRARLLFRHALRNAMNPIVTSASGWLAGLLAGAVSRGGSLQPGPALGPWGLGEVKCG